MPTHGPRPYDPGDYDASSVKLDRFLKAARDQIGDKYRFGAEASEDDANPTAFDSSELVEWAAHRAGFHDMPDGSWNQYRFLHEQGASVPVDEALRTPGALVFGFSSDPLESDERPARAYVGISLGNGKVLDVSERGGEVREMDPGGFYSYGAKIPEFHTPDEPTLDPDIEIDGETPVPGEPGWTPSGPGLPETIPVDTDGDGIPDASQRRPMFPGEADTDGDGIPDSSVPDPDSTTDPIDWGERRRRGIKMDDRTDQQGLPDMGPDDDPVVPSAPVQGNGPSGQIDGSYLPGDALPDDQVASYDDPLAGDRYAAPDGDGFDDGYGDVAQADPVQADPVQAPADDLGPYADAAASSGSPDFGGAPEAGGADTTVAYADTGDGGADYSDASYSDASYSDDSYGQTADA
jgi:hypothetical protein